MPDIAKWEELANIFEVNIDEILGCNVKNKNIEKYIELRKEEGSFNQIEWSELIDIVEFMEPQTIGKIIEKKHMDSEKIDIDILKNLLPYVSEETTAVLTDMLAEDVDMEIVYQMAPFLNDRAMENLLLKCNLHMEDDVSNICRLLPFLNIKSMAYIISDYEGYLCLDDVIQLAPFADENIMEVLLRKMDKNCQLDNLIKLAPFLTQNALDNLKANLIIQ